MGIHHSSVVRIIPDELRLKCVKKRQAQELTEANCITHLSHAKKLLSKFPERAVDVINFTDERVFTVAPLRTRPTFSKFVMVSVAVSKLGCTELIFVEPEVKVDSAYYRDVLLSHQMLPAI